MERVDLSKQALEHHASFQPDPASDQGQPCDQVKPPSDIVAVIPASFVSQRKPVEPSLIYRTQGVPQN